MIIIMLTAGILSFSCGLAAGYADSLCTCTIMTIGMLQKSCFKNNIAKLALFGMNYFWKHEKLKIWKKF